MEVDEDGKPREALQGGKRDPPKAAWQNRQKCPIPAYSSTLREQDTEYSPAKALTSG